MLTKARQLPRGAHWHGAAFSPADWRWRRSRCCCLDQNLYYSQLVRLGSPRIYTDEVVVFGHGGARSRCSRADRAAARSGTAGSRKAWASTSAATWVAAQGIGQGTTAGARSASASLARGRRCVVAVGDALLRPPLSRNASARSLPPWRQGVQPVCRSRRTLRLAVDCCRLAITLKANDS